MHPLIYIPTRKLWTPPDWYPVPRRAHGWVGAGSAGSCGAIGQRGGGWTPAKILGSLGAWWDFTETGLITNNTQPALVDGDMEAVGTAAWTSMDSTLSKVAGSPGGTGSQVLRVTSTADTFWARQTILTTGNRYRVAGWMRSDGTAAPKVVFGATSSTPWTGAASGAWQAVSGEDTSDGVGLLIGSSDSHPGWAEADDFTIENLSITQADPVAATGALAGSALVQAAAAAMGWEDDGLRCDGTADFYSSDAAASSWKYLHNGTGGSACLRFYIHAWNATAQGILQTSSGTANTALGIVVYGRPAGTNGDLRLYCCNGSGTSYAIDIGTVNCLQLGWNTLTYRMDATKYDIRVNGSSIDSGATGAVSASDPDQTLSVGDLNGTTDYKSNSTHKYLIVAGKYWSDSEVANLEAFVEL